MSETMVCGAARDAAPWEPLGPDDLATIPISDGMLVACCACHEDRQGYIASGLYPVRIGALWDARFGNVDHAIHLLSCDSIDVAWFLAGIVEPDIVARSRADFDRHVGKLCDALEGSAYTVAYALPYGTSAHAIEAAQPHIDRAIRIVRCAAWANSIARMVEKVGPSAIRWSKVIMGMEYEKGLHDDDE